MAAIHPQASPVEEHHQQRVSKKSQDSRINLLIVPERDEDGYCRRSSRGGERQRKLLPSHVVTSLRSERVERRRAAGRLMKMASFCLCCDSYTFLHLNWCGSSKLAAHCSTVSCPPSSLFDKVLSPRDRMIRTIKRIPQICEIKIRIQEERDVTDNSVGKWTHWPCHLWEVEGNLEGRRIQIMRQFHNSLIHHLSFFQHNGH